MSKKSELRGRIFNDSPSEIEVRGEKFPLAPIPMSLRTKLLAKMTPNGIEQGKEVRLSIGTMWEVGAELLLNCLLVEKEAGGGYERVFSEADRKGLAEQPTTDFWLEMAQAAIAKLTPQSAEQEALGKELKGTEISTSSSTTGANTDSSMTPPAS